MSSYIVKFLNNRIHSDGSSTPLLHGKESKKFGSRKAVFEFLDDIDALQTKRWEYSLNGDRIHCTEIEILEPMVVEKTLPNGTVIKRKSGYKAYTPGTYKMTFCRICGRQLTDPVSVARGIGPECIKKIGVH